MGVDINFKELDVHTKGLVIMFCINLPFWIVASFLFNNSFLLIDKYGIYVLISAAVSINIVWCMSACICGMFFKGALVEIDESEDVDEFKIIYFISVIESITFISIILFILSYFECELKDVILICFGWQLFFMVVMFILSMIRDSNKKLK